MAATGVPDVAELLQKLIVAPGLDEDDLTASKAMLEQASLASLLRPQLAQLFAQAIKRAELQSLCLLYVGRVVSSPEGASLVSKLVLPTLVTESVNITDISKLTACMVKLASYPAGLEALFLPEIATRMNDIAKQNESSLVAMLDLMCHVAGVTPEAFSLVAKSGWLARLQSSFASNDLLFKLNVIQLLSIVGQSVPGVAWFVDSGLCQTCHSTLSTPNPEDYLLLPRVIALIGDISRGGAAHLQLVTKFDWRPPFLKLLDHENDEVVLASLWALAGIGTSFAGLQYLAQDPSLLSLWLEYSSSSNAELRAGCLYGLATLFAARVAGPTPPDELKLLQDFYKKIFQSSNRAPAEGILRFLKEKVIDLRMATLQLMHSLLLFDFAISELVGYPGMAEFLLNRGTESTKEGKEFKFGMIQRILLHSQAKTLVPLNIYYDFVEYVKQGPFYQRGEAKTTVEDSGM